MKRYQYAHHTGYPVTEYYRDDDNDSGYGECAEVAFWYGPHEEAPATPPRLDWIGIGLAQFIDNPVPDHKE